MAGSGLLGFNSAGYGGDSCGRGNGQISADRFSKLYGPGEIVWENKPGVDLMIRQAGIFTVGRIA